MNTKAFFFIGLLLLSQSYITLAMSQRTVVDFNSDWQFMLEKDSGVANYVEDDSLWKKVTVPHDWAFEKGISSSGIQKGNGGYFGGGVGWYQKHFELEDAWHNKLVNIEFDGVYMNSEVWINDHYLGRRPYGYISFAYELTPYLREGTNTLKIKVDNSREPSARWYHPCGIYAPVNLAITSKLRVGRNGVNIKTLHFNEQQASVLIETDIESSNVDQAIVTLETIILDKNKVQQSISREYVTVNTLDTTAVDVAQTLTLSNPLLWNLKNPDLYSVKTRLFVQGQLVDEVITSFGIRKAEWRTETGFWLNGENIKLLGVSEHFEGGPVGGAWTEDLMRWKLQLLKDMGCNAIRAAHNPAPPYFYALCDEMGVLVMDEIFDGWKRKAPEDYGKQAFATWWKRDLTEWITRNRNHPSIIIYSVGNETGGSVGEDIVELCHQLDSTRMVTSGHSGSDFMDVFGVNGGSEKKQFFSKDLPSKPFVATEAPHTWQTRGYYRTQTWFRDGFSEKKGVFELPDLTQDEVFNYEWSSPANWGNKKQHFNSSYDNATVRISARKNWEVMRDLSWFSGHFRWTGFDYYGEATYVHGGWPFRLFMSGALDVAGFKKDLFYFYQSQWTEEPMVHILPHWTHPRVAEGTLIPVWVYSNCDEVELFFNGKSLGKDKPQANWSEMQCEWMVPWKAGKLVAVGYKNNKEVTQSEASSANTPSALAIHVEGEALESNTSDIAIITTSLTDAEDHFYPYGENKVYYHIDGPAYVRSLESGNPVDTMPNVNVNWRRTFMGSSRAFIQRTKQSEDIAVVMGAILGERQLLTSNKVSIDVKSVAIRGEVLQSKIKIFYTTDGSKATINSKLYCKPFKVALGTTVNAFVVRDGVNLFEMEESFVKDAGLYWGDLTYESLSTRISGGMQAEEAQFEGAVVMNKGANYFGKGYLDFNSKEGVVKWYQENDGSEGDFKLTLRYAMNDPRSNREMDLYVNGKKVSAVMFNKTGSWQTKWNTIEKTCHLQGGANYVELRTKGNSAPNIDELKID